MNRQEKRQKATTDERVLVIARECLAILGQSTAEGTEYWVRACINIKKALDRGCSEDDIIAACKGAVLARRRGEKFSGLYNIVYIVGLGLYPLASLYKESGSAQQKERRVVKIDV
ncbi:MAG: hypothetical protein QXT45_03480 [Candidatus Bilamarchaeaceae archaeon]